MESVDYSSTALKIAQKFRWVSVMWNSTQNFNVASFVMSVLGTVTLCLSSLIRIDITGLGVQLDVLLLEAMTSRGTEFLFLIHLALLQLYSMVMMFLHKLIILRWNFRQIH
jgi:hypothetical protein